MNKVERYNERAVGTSTMKKLISNVLNTYLMDTYYFWPHMFASLIATLYKANLF